MPAAYGSSNVTAEAANVTNTVYVAPTGIQDGDLLTLYHFGYNGSAAVPTVTPPAGWSVPALGTWPMLVTTGNGGHSAVYMWQKIASGESGNYTTTHAVTVATRGMIVRCTGASSTFDALSQNSGNSSTTTFLGITTVQDQDLIMAVGIDYNDSGTDLTPPTGTTPTFTERIDDNHGNYLATGVLSPAGATGNKTMTNNSQGGGISSFYGILIALKASFIADITTKPALPGMFSPQLIENAWF